MRNLPLRSGPALIAYSTILRIRRAAGRSTAARQACGCRVAGQSLRWVHRLLRSKTVWRQIRHAGCSRRTPLQAVFLPPDFPRYRAVSREAREIFKRHTDLIEPLSLDEAYVDVSENKTGLPTATQVARTIREQIRTELHFDGVSGRRTSSSRRLPRAGESPTGSLSFSRGKWIRSCCPCR
jgi:nucleotidyltransferase/DNA polymerase involved in DNA repair